MANPGTTTYPAAYDNFDNPVAGVNYENESGYSHAALHSQVHDAIEKIEAALGTHTAGTAVYAKNDGTVSNLEIIGGTQTSGKFDGGTIINSVIGTTNIITLGSIVTNSITADGQNDIVLSPGTAKFVKFQSSRQDSTTNTYQPNSVIQSGWTQIQWGTAVTRIAGTVTFPVAFTSAPIVNCTFLGFKTSGGSATSITQFTATTDDTNSSPRALNITGTSFTPELEFVTGNFGTAYFAGVSWIAIGTIA